MLYKKLIFLISLLTAVPTYPMDNWQPDPEIKQAVESWDLDRLQDIVNKRPFVDPYEPEKYYQFLNTEPHDFYVQEGFGYIQITSLICACLSGLGSLIFRQNDKQYYPQHYKPSTIWEKIKFTTFKTLYYSCVTVFGISGTIALLSNLRGGYARYCYKKMDPIFDCLEEQFFRARDAREAEILAQQQH